MKSVVYRLLPLLFVALLSLAPMQSQAAGNFGPAGPREGMFDCLGDLDWGCKIIGFLFESTNNEVTYVKDGATVVDTQTPPIKALHAMMGFFSNALLVFAAIKLLYELLQMTAESAQSGQVGGKDTNQLWAPIRLVIAIGLLVPLDTGLNSGQYIVMQIAKWGSGMASQAWKVFIVGLTSSDTLTAPSPPRIRSLAVSTAKTYACQRIVNYYETQLGTNNFVKETDETGDGTVKTVFKNKVHDNLCGYIRYRIPLRAYANTKKDADLSLELSNFNQQEYKNAQNGLQSAANTMADGYLPLGRNQPKPTSQELERVIQSYQDAITNKLASSNPGRQAMDAIINQIKAAADTEGWTSAGTWFLAITRAQGQIINGGANIPEASGPNMTALASYPDALRDYNQFEADLNQGTRPQNTSSAPVAGSASAGISVNSESTTWMEYLRSIVRGIGEAPADGLFWFLDRSASAVGLWDPDPRKAFGDLGGSNNPFGEIAALGHKKIRYALNCIGWAMVTTAGGLAADGLKTIAGPFGKVLFGGASGILSGLTAILMMFATLFLLAGVLLAFIVPMFPFTRFFFSILTWIGSLIEAMILVPFMALAFLTPKGEGFAGQNTRNAFYMIFQLFLRPILCLFGLICAMLMFYVAAKFLNASFYEATSGVGVYEGSAMRFMQKLVYSVMYVGLIYSAANISFKMIEHIPKTAMKWMGGNASEESYDDHSNFLGIATAVGGQQLLQQFQAVPQNLLAPVSKGFEGVTKERDTQSANRKQLAALRESMAQRGMKPDANQNAVPWYQGDQAATDRVDRAESDYNTAQQQTQQARTYVEQQENEITRLLNSGASQSDIDSARTELAARHGAYNSRMQEEQMKLQAWQDLKYGRRQ